MIKELYNWFNTVIDHALSLWVVFIVVTAVWVSTAWAVRKWMLWYKKNGRANGKGNCCKDKK